MKTQSKYLLAVPFVAALAVASCGSSTHNDDAASANAALVAQGKEIFRSDTFGDEAFWTDTLQMNDVIATVTPATALAVGLKVDVDALPPAVVQGILDESIKLDDAKTTLALLKLNAVIGVKGTVETINGVDTLTRLGITCALCHSTVDQSVELTVPNFGTIPKGKIGKRLDGWANRDLDPGLIISLSPVLSAGAKAIYSSWGPGKYDPRFNFDGINGPQVIPPAYGLAGLHSITSTGDGSDIAYWNQYVAVTQMGGQGSFSEPRIPGVSKTNGTTDLVTSKLPALQAYQLSLAAPTPKAGDFDQAAADRGKVVFNVQGTCATCHSGPLFSDGNTTLHDPADVVSEPEPGGVASYASRSATKKYRTAPLAGLSQHAPYFHNGSAATLEDVVETYNTKKTLGLSVGEKADLVQYLKSL